MKSVSAYFFMKIISVETHLLIRLYYSVLNDLFISPIMCFAEIMEIIPEAIIAYRMYSAFIDMACNTSNMHQGITAISVIVAICHNFPFSLSAVCFG